MVFDLNWTVRRDEFVIIRRARVCPKWNPSVTSIIRNLVPFFFFPSLMSCTAESKPPEKPPEELTHTVPNEPANQETPTRVLEKLHVAILAKDRVKFMECYQVPLNGGKFLYYFFDMWTAKYGFLAAIEAAYGSEGLAYFTDPRTAKEPGMFILTSPPLHSPWWESESIRVRVNGDDAAYLDPFYLYRELTMARNNGVWRIHPLIPPNAEWEIQYGMLIEAMRLCSNDIGKPGVSLDDIRRKLGGLLPNI